MKKALVLSSGAAWCAFQIGALEYLAAERNYNFDICAGTGIGAMNAAFVACDEFSALNEFWNNMGWLKLISFNWKHPFRNELFTGKPQKKFIEKHISVDKLRKNNRKLIFSTLNIADGKQTYFSYPGSDVSLADALIGAATVPGLTPPFTHKTGPLVDGMFINSFILDYIITNYAAGEYVGIAALPAGKAKYLEKRKYNNWRKMLNRTLQINLSRDINKGIKNGRDKIELIRFYQRAKKNIESKIGDSIEDGDARQQILNKIEQNFTNSANTFRRESVPELIEIITRKEVEGPIWSFRKKYIQELKEKGYKIAGEIIS